MGSSYSQTAVVSGTVEHGYESVRHQFTFYSYVQPQCYRFVFFWIEILLFATPIVRTASQYFENLKWTKK
jgi:hypothetical protein